MNLVPYDDDRHRGFVLPTFSMQAGLPGATIDRLVRAGAHIVVAESPSNPELFYGWGGAHNGALVWCYVKRDLAKFKLDPGIMEALGVDVKGRIPCLFMGQALRAMTSRYGWTFEWMSARGQDAIRGQLARTA